MFHMLNIFCILPTRVIYPCQAGPNIILVCYGSLYCVGICRTGAVEEARRLIEMFGWSQYFCMQEIYPGDKTSHFIRFAEFIWFTNFPFFVPLFSEGSYMYCRPMYNPGLVATAELL